MVYQGTIQNGVVIFENGVQLPEGSPVRVELLKPPAISTTPPASADDDSDDDLLNMTKFAVDMGIPDLAVNIDHYLYGHPKVSDGQ